MDLLTFIRKADIFDLNKIENHLGLEKDALQKLPLNDSGRRDLTLEKLHWFFKTIGISGPWNSSINPGTKLMDCLPGEKEIPA